jgi:hypothetical protein
VIAWSNSEMNAAEFIQSFKSELASLEKQVVEIVKPIIETNTSHTSLPNL